MKEFSAQAVKVETMSALDTVNQARGSSSYPAYIGLDVHKETIVISVARAGRGAPDGTSQT